MKSIALAIWPFVLACLLTACGNGPRESERSSVVVRLEAEPDQLNPAFATMSASVQVFDNIFSYLLYYDPETRAIAPQLAEAMPSFRRLETGPDAGRMAYSFRIHDAARWDDGTPVTGYDFLFTLKALFNPAVPAAGYRAYFDFLHDVRISATDPKAFEVITASDLIQAEEYIGSTIPVLPAHQYDPEGLLRPYSLAALIEPEDAEALASDPVLRRFAEWFARPAFAREPGAVSGSGPYRLVGWESGRRIRLEAKPNWWGEPLAAEYPLLRRYPEAIEYAIIPDGTTTVAALQAQEIDVAYNLAPAQFTALQEAAGPAETYQFFTPQQNAYYFVAVNQRRPRLADVRVRRALAHAIDVEAIIEGVYRGYGRRMAGPVAPDAPYHHDGLEPYVFDPDLARELLASAGWEDADNNGILDRADGGERQEFRLEYTFLAQRETSRNAALLIQDDLRRVGIELELRPREAGDMFAQMRQGTYDLASAGRTLPLSLWNPKQHYHSQGENRTGFANPEADRLIDRILGTREAAERDSLYVELQAMIYRQVPEIPLFAPTARLVVHRRLEPLLSPAYPNVVASRLKLKEAGR